MLYQSNSQKISSDPVVTNFLRRKIAHHVKAGEENFGDESNIWRKLRSKRQNLSTGQIYGEN